MRQAEKEKEKGQRKRHNYIKREIDMGKERNLTFHEERSI